MADKPAPQQPGQRVPVDAKPWPAKQRPSLGADGTPPAPPANPHPASGGGQAGHGKP